MNPFLRGGKKLVFSSTVTLNVVSLLCGVLGVCSVIVLFMAHKRLGLLIILSLVGILIVYLVFFRGRKLAIKKAIVPLLIGAVLLPSLPMPFELPSVRMDLILILIAWGLLSFGNIATQNKVTLHWSSTHKWFFLFGLSIMMSMIWAALVMGYAPFWRDFFELAKLLEYFLIFSLIASLRITPLEMEKYYVITIFIFLISAGFGFAQYWNLFNVNASISPYFTSAKMEGLLKYSRVIGTTGNPNLFGGLMILPASLALSGTLWLKRNYLKVFSVLAFSMFSFTIVLTQSRSALISLVAVVLYILFFKYPRRFRSGKAIKDLLLIIPALLIIAYVVTQVAPVHFFTRIETLSNITTASGWGGRIEKWESNLKIWGESPLFGWGRAQRTMRIAVDNEWLTLLRQYGIVGLAVFIFWFVGIYFNLGRIGRESRVKTTEVFSVALQAVLIAYAVFMIPAGVYHNLQLAPIVMFYLGLVYSQGNFPMLSFK